MLGLLVICSLLLLLLGGFEVFVKPFQESLRHGLAFVLIPPYAIYYLATRWNQMKRPCRKAIGAFIPLIVLLLLVLFSRPIRDWFLHSPHKKGETETSSTLSSGTIDHSLLAERDSECPSLGDYRTTLPRAGQPQGPWRPGSGLGRKSIA